MDNTKAIESTEKKPPEKHNLGAKIGISFLLGGVIGGKLAIPGLIADAYNLFPKGTPFMERVKRTFSQDIIHLLQDDIAKQINKGRSHLTALLVTTKWSTIAPIVGGIGLAVIGWKRADKIKNSKDIITHPWESTKIILGFKEPENESRDFSAAAKDIVGKHTQKVVTKQKENLEHVL